MKANETLGAIKLVQISKMPFCFHSEYDQSVLEKSGPPTKPDPPVARVLVYTPTAGDTFSDVTGKQKFTIVSSG